MIGCKRQIIFTRLAKLPSAVALKTVRGGD